jgi:hypothetical protein
MLTRNTHTNNEEAHMDTTDVIIHLTDYEEGTYPGEMDDVFDD